MKWGSTKALPQFKQYRESDGKFYFKLLDEQGRLLLQSQGFSSPKIAAENIAIMKESGVVTPAMGLDFGEGIEEEAVASALARLRDAI